MARHSKANDQAFSADNLCPNPVHQLWQNAPQTAFHELESPATQGRLALCRPISGLQESDVIDGLEKYAHISGAQPGARGSQHHRGTLPSPQALIIDHRGLHLDLYPCELLFVIRKPPCSGPSAKRPCFVPSTSTARARCAAHRRDRRCLFQPQGGVAGRQHHGLRVKQEQRQLYGLDSGRGECTP